MSQVMQGCSDQPILLDMPHSPRRRLRLPRPCRQRRRVCDELTARKFCCGPVRWKRRWPRIIRQGSSGSWWKKWDLSQFLQDIEARGETPGRAANRSEDLVALWLFAYTQGVSGGRELARLCEQHDAYRWLLGE